MFAGALLPLWDVVLFGGLGLVLGSIIAFFLARYGGRPIVVKMIGHDRIDDIDSWVSKNGTGAVLLTRIIPVVPFDLVSYISGVTPIKFKDYLAATVIGAIPRCLFLAYAGSVAGGILLYLGTGIELLFTLGVIGFFVLAYLEKRGYIRNFEKSIMGRITRGDDK